MGSMNLKGKGANGYEDLGSTVRNSLGHHVSDKYNPRVQKACANNIILDRVLEKVTLLVNGDVTRAKLAQVIVIARDRMHNYEKEGGNMNRPVAIKTDAGRVRRVYATYKDKNGQKHRVLVKTVADMKIKIQNFVDANSAIVAAYDAGEAERMRNSYEAKRSKRR